MGSAIATARWIFTAELYSKTPGQPEAVDLKPGKTTKIELAFDDSVKMKGGNPTPQ